jgi:WXG100 family type VII secretion target
VFDQAPGGNVLAVDFAALNDLSTAIQRSIEQAEEILTTLAKQLAGVAEMWTGAASEGFRESYAAWSGSEQDLQRQLQALHDLVVTAHNNHAQAARRNVAIWRI